MRSSSGVKLKRARTDDSLGISPPSVASPSPTSAIISATPASSTFRNVSACNRCRQRKNRCDQNLPACASCEKARVKCVGWDPITRREIPRAYVYYLESRLNYLETLLNDNAISYSPADQFDLGAKSPSDPQQNPTSSDRADSSHHGTVDKKRVGLDALSQSQDARNQEQAEKRRLNTLVSNIGMVSVQGTSDPRFLGPTSGISFARVVFASIKSSVSTGSSKKGVQGSSKPAATANRTTVRDSLFGLQPKPNLEPAPFPGKEVGLRLVELYFEHANPQIPILHKGEFMTLFHHVYASADSTRSARESYMLNIVFAIGAGIILEDSSSGPSSGSSPASATSRESTPQEADLPTTLSKQHQPEEYHAAAMAHLDSFLGSMALEESNSIGGGLEELQAVLLLASFALLRPVPPGLWYISGIATRLGVDLGLHQEDGTDLDEAGAVDQGQNAGMLAKSQTALANNVAFKAKQQGHREWVRDMRRRLWWCVYAFDRLISTCVGRPFGITDQVITTNFPSILNDEDITRSGFTTPTESFNGPSYKRVSHHYFRLRLLQSEILQVLQYRQARSAYLSSSRHCNPYMPALASPFLQRFESFRAWRQDMDHRLFEWKESAPQQQDITVQFSVQFLELNYWQAIIMLYRQTLSSPAEQQDPASPFSGLGSPVTTGMSDDIDDEDVFLRIAEAGQRVLMLYRQLHRIHLVNYTYLATVHLFMAGIAFLYVLWHSPTVRSRLTLDDVDFTVLAATSVLGDLTDKCPPAEACRDAFERMSRATIKLCLSTTGFGSQPQGFGAQKYPRRQGDQEQNVDVDRRPQLRSGSEPRKDDTCSSNYPRNDLPGSSGILGEDSYGQGQAALRSVVPPHHQTFPSFGDMKTSASDQAFEEIHSNDPMGLGSNDPSYGSHGSSMQDDMDTFLADNDTLMYDGQLGSIMGLDDHEWTDGVQLDMFDGFFFGGMNSESYHT